MIKKEDIIKYTGCYPDGRSKSELEINIMLINKSSESYEIQDNIISHNALLNIYADRNFTTLTALFQDEERTILSEGNRLLNRFQDAHNSYDESSSTFMVLNVAVISKVKNEHHFITGTPLIWFACASDIDGKIDTLKIIFKNDSIYTM